MKIICIEENSNIGRIKRIIKPMSKSESKIIINSEISKLKLKNKLKLAKKIKKIVLKEDIKKVILSNEIKQDKEFANLLISNNINLPNERWIFKMLIPKVIDIILKNKKKQETKIWITVNDIDIIVQNIILKFAKEFKQISIITNHINKFKKIEEKLYKEEGIIITVTNNRRKSLLNADLILNIDFPKEILNQFAIFDKSTIINVEGNMFIKKKRFEGRIINDINIISFEDEELLSFIEKNKLQNYDIKDLCEILNIVPKCDIILK